MLAAITAAAAFIGRIVLVLSPVTSILSTIWSFITSPIGKAILVVGLIVGAYAIGDIKGRVKEHEFMAAKSKVEVANAVKEANAAREAAEKKFDESKFIPVPARPAKPVPGGVRHNGRAGKDFSRD